MGRNGKFDRFVSVIVIVTGVVIPHILPILAGFVGLQRSEGRLIKRYKIIIFNSPLLRIEEINAYYGYNN